MLEPDQQKVMDELMQMSSAPVEAPIHDLPEQFEILGKVSQGGMGWIYKARNKYTESQVAIKVLKPEYARDTMALQRFIVEAKAALALKHPNICQVYDFGVTERGVPYLVMDWIDGISLGAKVTRDSRIQPKEAIIIFKQIANALAFSHKHKVVHRDLKPDNIMLARDENGKSVVQIVDFGIAKVLEDENVLQKTNLTQTGIVVGTPTYMSPEQSRGEAVDGRTDIYSLGCMLFFALVGRPPFIGATVIDTITKHMTEPVPELDPALKVPSDLKMIMLTAMEKNREDRYQTMEEVETDLNKITQGISITHRKLAVHRVATKKKRVTALSFIVGFALMYGFSILVQSLLDGGSASKNGAPSKSSVPPKADSTAPKASNAGDTPKSAVSGSTSARTHHPSKLKKGVH